MIEHDHVSRLLAARVATTGPHHFQHIAIAHLGTEQLKPLALEEAFQPQVRHHRGDDPTAAQLPCPCPLAADQRHDLIAVHCRPGFVDDDQPVGVAIQGNADIRAAGDHGFLDQVEVGGAAPVVDVATVGIDADRDHFGAQFPEGRRGDLVGGAMGAIERDLQPVEPDIVGQRAFHCVDIAATGIVDTSGAADIGCVGQRLIFVQHGLDRQFVGIGQLEPVRPEQLDAVVLVRVVAGRDHHADICPQFAGQQGNGRSGHRPEQHHVHADAGKACDHGIFQHVARKPGVLADDHAVAVVTAKKAPAGRLADLHCRGGGHRTGIGAPANAIGTKILASHLIRPC